MYSELKSLSEEEQERRLKEYILCYDNRFNVDALVVAEENLPLPRLRSGRWKTAKKVSDRLHIRNHKNKKCFEIYNPDDQSMTREQTLAWMSRFKKIVIAMTHSLHVLFLHRMCERRNRHTPATHIIETLCCLAYIREYSVIASCESMLCWGLTCRKVMGAVVINYIIK